MDNNSDYIIYVDESGNHGLGGKYPVFVLAFCIFHKDVYTNHVVPALQKFKFQYWGHDTVILHERDIRKVRDGDYAFLNDTVIREKFMHDLSLLMGNLEYTIIASTIAKGNDKQDYEPDKLAMLSCMENLFSWLYQHSQEGKSVHIVFESRGKSEDRELELEFRRICDNAPSVRKTVTNFKNIQFNIHFVCKKANSTGLQIADLVARPIGKNYLNPKQTNRAFDTIKNKIFI